MRRKRKNQIRWNVEAEPTFNVSHYYFWIINSDPTAHARIRTNLALVFQPIDKAITLTGKKKYRDNFDYSLYVFDSPAPPPVGDAWKKVYDGEIIRDKKLYQRQKLNGLENFVDSQMARL